MCGNENSWCVGMRLAGVRVRGSKFVHDNCTVVELMKITSNTGTHTLKLLKDVVRVADILTRHLYRHGDKLLEEDTPIALSVNEMYSITKRLRLPMDAQGVGGWSHNALLYYRP